MRHSVILCFVMFFPSVLFYSQHTDVFMPHFRGKEWTWLRGMYTILNTYETHTKYILNTY